MIIEPKVRGFVCTTAHPVGCTQHVRQQIDEVNKRPKTNGAKKVLVIGASMGYGLASRIAAAYSIGAATIGIIFDKPATGNRTASAGFYNTAAFEHFAHQDGLYAKSLNGDAFSAEMKQKTIALIQQDLGKVDMVIYSLASPRRTMEDGTVYRSVLKTTKCPYTNKTLDLSTRVVSEITVPCATQQEIEHTVKVMGGEDWMDWMLALKQANVLEPNATTIAYSYIGPELTHPMYRNGSIGQAKDHLWHTAKQLTEQMDVRAYLAVNKALVTQSSAAIPIVPLYITVLYKIMKQQGNHENCIQQMYRLLHDKLFQEVVQTDPEGRLRLDDWEMLPTVQAEVARIWQDINSDSLEQNADIDGYWQDFYNIFGFRIPGVDYSQSVDPQIEIPSIPSPNAANG